MQMVVEAAKQDKSGYMDLEFLKVCPDSNLRDTEAVNPLPPTSPPSLCSNSFLKCDMQAPPCSQASALLVSCCSNDPNVATGYKHTAVLPSMARNRVASQHRVASRWESATATQQTPPSNVSTRLQNAVDTSEQPDHS